jgi:hypothetical protein
VRGLGCVGKYAQWRIGAWACVLTGSCVACFRMRQVHGAKAPLQVALANACRSYYAASSSEATCCRLARQHAAVLRGNMLPSCEATCCRLARQHAAVLRGNMLPSCEATCCRLARQHAAVLRGNMLPSCEATCCRLPRQHAAVFRGNMLPSSEATCCAVATILPSAASVPFCRDTVKR